ncbi:hypothetical protein [Clavibacter michiganensis]|uniref:hypothetical protein n=1 Tax=Clavibacter michiganensis TaxID=28447 RepID=UPI001D0A8547|nr:hypothetical protein [Clavibacter michiganensis]UDM19082.1 hypothetical protein LHJ47_08185 [Clavibacter michiganensis subsp. michiganensis]
MRRSIIALVIGAALAAGGAVALPVPADALPGRPYYSLPFTDALVYTARVPDRGAAFATVEQWQADGSPVPTPATVAYRVLPWDSTVYADVNVGITDFGVALDAAQWRRAGSPAPTRGVLPEASEIWQHPGSDELLVRTRYGWDRHSAVWHTMTFPEWRTLGFPPVDRRGEHVYERLSWLETVVARRDRGVDAHRVSFDEWSEAGRPTPGTVAAFPGDRYCSVPGSAEIRYVGIAEPNGLALSFERWIAAGSPQASGSC